MIHPRKPLRRLLVAAALVGATVLAACNQQQVVTQPDPFQFPAVTGAEPGQMVTSATVTIQGNNVPLDAKVTTGAVLIINGSVAGANPQVKAGDKVSVRVTASTSFLTTVKATVTIGEVKGDFLVTTRAAKSTPDAFSFIDVGGQNLQTPVTSATVTLTGFDGVLEAELTPPGAGVLVVNGTDSGSSADVRSGDTLAVRVQSAADYDQWVTTTVTIGGVSADFRVGTKSRPVAPAITNFQVSDAAPEPGATVTLSWTVTGDVESLVLSNNVEGVVDHPSPAASSIDVEVPTYAPSVTYTLVARNDETGDGDLDSVVVTVEFWICKNDDYPIVIADAHLLAALQDDEVATTNLPSGTPTCADMKAITSIDTHNGDLDRGEIASLSGLQHASNLESLKLDWNDVASVAPLAHMQNLRELRFDRNSVVFDLAPLASLPNLELISLWDVGPTVDDGSDGYTDADVAHLAGITSLEEVYVSNNNIDSLSFVSGMTNLRVLYAMNNNISDLQPLSGKTDLRSVLLGWQTNDTTLNTSALATLSSLSVIGLEYWRLPSTDVFADAENLWQLRLEGNLLNDIDGLLGNASFPAAAAPAGAGPIVSVTPSLGLADNCLEVVGPTSAGITSLQGLGVTVTGYPDDQFANPCVIGTAMPSWGFSRQMSLDAARQSGMLR